MKMGVEIDAVAEGLNDGNDSEHKLTPADKYEITGHEAEG